MDVRGKLRRLIEQGHDYYYSDAYNGASVYNDKKCKDLLK